MGMLVSFNENCSFSLWERSFPTVGTVVPALGNRVRQWACMHRMTIPFLSTDMHTSLVIASKERPPTSFLSHYTHIRPIFRRHTFPTHSGELLHWLRQPWRSIHIFPVRSRHLYMPFQCLYTGSFSHFPETGGRYSLLSARAYFISC